MAHKIPALLISLKRRGVKKTISVLLALIMDFYFDIKYGTDTKSWVKLGNLDIASDNKERGVMYQPTLVLPLKKLFGQLTVPKDSILVDLGCGKGRVLLIASEFGFRELRGVEFSPELCKIAIKNCSIYKEKTKSSAGFRILESDVVNYDARDDETFFFMFNPFDAIVLKQVLDKIAASLLARQRRIWIIYRNPVHNDIVEEHGTFTRFGEFHCWGQDFIIYKN